jgi:hypothetical protein
VKPPEKPEAKSGTMRSPRSGAVVRTGAHPANTGGKKGRSGRKPDAFKEQLAGIRDREGVALLRKLLKGEITYALKGRCTECGKESKGDELLRVTPSPDVRARALDMTMRYTVGLERVVRVELEGFRDVARAFDLIKTRIRSTLAPELAEALIDDIQQELRAL